MKYSLIKAIRYWCDKVLRITNPELLEKIKKEIDREDGKEFREWMLDGI